MNALTNSFRYSCSTTSTNVACSDDFMRSYRYGFQGQERDDEVKGEGNSWNYKYRMHDPRIGRFFAIDPLTMKFPYYTPYSFSGNRVIDAIEYEGLEEVIITRFHKNNGKTQLSVIVMEVRSMRVKRKDFGSTLCLKD